MFSIYMFKYPNRTVLNAESNVKAKCLNKEPERDIGNESFMRESFKLAVGEENKELIESGHHLTVQVS